MSTDLVSCDFWLAKKCLILCHMIVYSYVHYLNSQLQRPTGHPIFDSDEVFMN